MLPDKETLIEMLLDKLISISSSPSQKKLIDGEYLILTVPEFYER